MKKKKVMPGLAVLLLLIAALLLCGCGAAANASEKAAAQATPEATPTPTPTPTPPQEVTFPDGSVHKLEESSLSLTSLKHADVDAYVDCLKQMKSLSKVDLGEQSTARGLSWEDVGKLEAACPGADLNYGFTLFEKHFTTLDEEMNFHHVPMDDEGAAVREVLPHMKHCKLLDMDFTGVSSERMAEIRDEYPDMKVVWRIFFGTDCSVRTDVERILASNLNHALNNYNTKELKYCTKVRLFDVGHNQGLSDFSFMEYMPDLEVVIVSMTGFSDLNVLRNARNLEYLEFHSCKEGMDLSPLVNNPNLEHICCCFLGRVQGWEAIKSLTKLQRFHMGYYTLLPDGALEELRELMPNCDFNNTNTVGSTGDWRYEANAGLVPRYAELCQQFEYDNYAHVCSSWFNDPMFYKDDGSYDYKSAYWFFPAE